MALKPAQVALRFTSAAPLYEAQLRHPALACFSSMDAIVEALHVRPAPLIHSDDLLRAMIVEYVSSSHPAFWSAALLVAMSPMLLRMRVYFSSEYMCAADIDQLLLEHFLKSVLEMGEHLPSDRIAMRLRLATRRSLFADLQQTQRDFQELLALREQVLSYAFNPFDEVDDEDQTDVMSQLFSHALRDDLSAEQLQLLTHTLFDHKRIRDYLRASSCEYAAEAASERRYQAVKRQHSRLLKLVQHLIVERIPFPLALVRRLQKGASEGRRRVQA